MHKLSLRACTSTPFGAYLKALGVFRLVSTQKDGNARGYWEGDTFVLETSLDRDELLNFFVEQYEPTPILAPWNGGSGFYDRGTEQIAAILNTTSSRFDEYRQAIRICQSFREVQEGKELLSDKRRSAIHLRCRNLLSDKGVEWLDAAAGIGANGMRSCTPILGTGGNDGNLEFTNNFMARIVRLLISPGPEVPVHELIANAIFGTRVLALREGAAGQFDPGHSGGANQDAGIEPKETLTNPWDLVLTLEGAVAWAGGLYRRQGSRCRSVLCSPFTVRAEPVGYGSASVHDETRAEIWTPLWNRRVCYAELKTLLREGRACIEGRPAANTVEFAQAARSLGVDRNIDRFVRYSILMRRGKSYIALPTGTFPTGYKSESDLVREFQQFLETVDSRALPKSAADLRREIDSAVYHVLLTGGQDRIRELMAALGRMLRRIVTTTDTPLPRRRMRAGVWIEQCGAPVPEVRIAAALASIYDPKAGGIKTNLSRAEDNFAWTGLDLCERLTSTLSRRLQQASAVELTSNPIDGFYRLHPGDVTLFIEGSVDDRLIEDLLFGFVVLDWKDFKAPRIDRAAETFPVYAVLKHLFLPGEIPNAPEPTSLRADPRILSLLAAGDIQSAAAIAVHRLRVARLRPLEVEYHGGADPGRLAASLLIPVRAIPLANGIFHPDKSLEAYA